MESAAAQARGNTHVNQVCCAQAATTEAASFALVVALGQHKDSEEEG